MSTGQENKEKGSPHEDKEGGNGEWSRVKKETEEKHLISNFPFSHPLLFPMQFHSLPTFFLF